MSGRGRVGSLVLMIATAGLPLMAQSMPQALNGVRQQVSSSAPAKSSEPQQPAGTSLPSAQAKLVSVRSTTARRDPFSSLVGKDKPGGVPEHLPPGKAGLVIATLRVDGIIRGPNGMIAIVSNPQQRVYFLRDGDRLFDGEVEKIRMDGISFHQTGKDPFGKPVERQIDKRLYPTPGEQQ